MKYNNYNKLSNIQKYYLIVNAAKIVKYRFEDLLDEKSGLHCHHIKPKSLYPDLANYGSNIIKVPAIVHWALHKILLDYYKEINNEVAIKKMSYVNLEDFINKFYENRKKKFNFDVVGSEIFFEVFYCCKNIIDNVKQLQLLEMECEIECESIKETFSKKKNESVDTDEYEHYKIKGKYYKEYLRELYDARYRPLDKKEKIIKFIKDDYLNLTEDLLDMYGEDIKDELDDPYKDFDDLYNTLKSIEEEFNFEQILSDFKQNMSDEELREELKEL